MRATNKRTLLSDFKENTEPLKKRLKQENKIPLNSRNTLKSSVNKPKLNSPLKNIPRHSRLYKDFSSTTGKLPASIRGTFTWKPPATPIKSLKEDSAVLGPSRNIDTTLTNAGSYEKSEEVKTSIGNEQLDSIIDKRFSTLHKLTLQIKDKKIKRDKFVNRATVDKFVDAIAELKGLLDRWLETKAFLENDLKNFWSQLNCKLESDTVKSTSLELLNANLSETLHKAEESIKLYKSKTSELDTEKLLLESKVDDLNTKLEELKIYNEKSLSDQNSLCERVKRELESEREQHQQTLQQLNTIERNYEDLSKTNKTLTLELEALKNRLEEKNSEFSSTMATFSRTQEAHQATINDLNEENKVLKECVSKLNGAEYELLTIKEELRKQTSLCSEFQLFEKELKEALIKKDELLQKQANEIWQLKRDLNRSQEAFSKCETEIGELKENNRMLQSNVTLQSELARELTSRLKQLHDNSGIPIENVQIERICKLSMENEELKAKISILECKDKEFSEAQGEIAELKQKLYEAEERNRILHNTIQDLKGKVRVFVRIRPSWADAQRTAVKSDTDLHMECRGTQHVFKFDRVFGPVDSQETVFEEVALFVQSALHGYNTCVIAYGQTGAGKTFTMHGGRGKEAGIVRRAAQKIVETAQVMKATGWEYSFTCNYVEIYNEQVRDLLASGAPKVNMRIIGSEVLTKDFHEKTFSSVDEVDLIVSSAEKQRSVAATNMNETSSRSHSVFILKLQGVHVETKTKLNGCLYLCDLAGSERIAKSGATGDRLKEAQNINKSLSTLTDVLRQLHEKADHIRYRDSKLTILLQPCFTCSGKSLMIVNVAPEPENERETLNSLKFAAKVCETELGKTIRNIIKY